MLISNKHKNNYKKLIRGLIYLSIFTLPLSIAGANISSGLLFLAFIPAIFIFDLKLFSGKYNKSIWGFLIIILLSSFWAYSPANVIEKFISPVLQYVVLYYAVINFIEEENQIKTTIFVFWVFTFISALYGGYEYFVIGVNRAEGFLKISNRLGSVMMMYIILNYSIILFNKKIKYRLFGLIGMSAGLLGLFASVSRQALLASFIGIFIVSILKSKKNIILFFIVILIIISIMPGAYINRLSNLTSLESGNKARLLMYRAGWEIFKDNTILGIGFNNIRSLHQESTILDFLSYDHRQLHNIFINIAVELGLLGLISFLTVFTLTLKNAWFNMLTNKNYLSVAIIGIISGQLFQNTVDVMMHTTQVGLIFIFFISLSNLKNNYSTK